VTSKLTSLVALFTLSALGPAAASASPGVNFSFSPPSQTAAVGQVFRVDILVDGSEQEIDALEAYIDFDPAYLQVVDEGGSVIAGTAEDIMVPGTVTANQFTDRLLNRIDNDNGHADIAYGIGPAGSPVRESFVLGTVRFKALAESPGTTPAFHSQSGRTTTAVRQVNCVTGKLTGATVVISAADSSTPAEPGEDRQQAGEHTGPADGTAGLSVKITSPGDGTIITSVVQTVVGIVSDPGIDVATLTINRRYRPITVTHGRFREKVTLTPGANTISVAVADSAGNVASARITVRFGEAPVQEDVPAATEGSMETTGEATAPPEDKPLTWPMMGGIVGGILVVGLLVYYFAARSRY